MSQVKTMILNWELVGATVAIADSVIQAQFFKGLAEGLATYDSDYHRQLQLGYASSQKDDRGYPILTPEHFKTLESCLEMLWPSK